MVRVDRKQKGPFQDELRRLRSHRGDSQADVARGIGATQAAVSIWEADRHPSPRSVRLLEHYFGVEPGHLERLIERPALKHKTSPEPLPLTMPETRPPRSATPPHVGTVEDVALLLSGHTQESYQRLQEATERLRQVLADSQAEMEVLSERFQSAKPGSEEFTRLLRKMDELHHRLITERASVSTVAQDARRVEDMADRIKFVLGRSALGTTDAVLSNDSSQPQPLQIAIELARASERQQSLSKTRGLRGALTKWQNAFRQGRSRSVDDPELNDLLKRLVSTVSTLRDDLADTRAELRTVRSMLNHPSQVVPEVTRPTGGSTVRS